MQLSKPLPGVPLASEDDSTDESEDSVVARRLHDFFSEQGLPRHKHASQLALILGLSRSGAFRKFQDASFSASDLQTLAQHFQVDISALLSAEPAMAAPRVDGDVHDARVLIGSLALGCKATLGAPLQPGEHCELVATEQGAEWLIQPYGASDPNIARRRVLQLVVTPSQRALPRIAVLEDSRDLAANMKDAFEASGYRVELFGSAAELARRAAEAPFDGYLMDWWLNGQTANQVLQAIRRAQPSVPMLLTTGAIAAGHAGEADIVQVATTLRIPVIEKPFRLALVISQLRQLLEQAQLSR
nr:helix-turn-helix domain-containing protein [Variovorax boronicumulans]